MNSIYTPYLSLGTNEGNRLENLQKAIDVIAKEIGTILKVSSIYETPSWGFDGNDFYNICIQVTTELEPEKLLKNLLKIEKELGRIRLDKDGYQNRNIDIDILLINDKIINTKTLTVPHAKMLERLFVLNPLVEIAGDEIHPITKEKLDFCKKNCKDNAEIIITQKKLIVEKRQTNK